MTWTDLKTTHTQHTASRKAFYTLLRLILRSITQRRANGFRAIHCLNMTDDEGEGDDDEEGLTYDNSFRRLEIR